MSPSDLDLLRQYSHDGSQAAFTALVERHLNLVYSAACRQVGSPQLADEVAQSVFIDLARTATSFPPAMPLVAWLHVVTRRTAIDVVRRESRRQTREQQAAALAACGELAESAMKSDAPDWATVAPLLDEAVDALDAPDRTAILLRYFENKSLREVGASLGTSDDAAQKRVSRALEQLRAFFARRGVALTAAGLATDLSAHAVQTAPAALGATLSSTALSGGASAVILQSAQAITLSTAQKVLLAATLSLAASGLLFQAHLLSLQRRELATLRGRTADLFSELQRTRRERDQALADRRLSGEQLASAEARGRKLSTGDPAAEAALETWLARVHQLKDQLQQMPDKRIPEMQYLTDEDWLAVAHEHPKLATDFEVRDALAALRNMAQNHVAKPLSAALDGFVKAHDGQLPNDPSQLAPYLDRQTDPAILQRYEMLRTGLAEDHVAHQWTFVMQAKPVDDYQDILLSVGTLGGYGLMGSHRGEELVGQAAQSFRAAHGGQSPIAAAQLTPYLPRPVEAAIVEKYFKDDVAAK